MEAYEVMKVYGDNLVGTEGADWKRHRSVAKPAFNEAGNAFVWMETTRVVNEWFGELDAAQEKHGSGTITIDAMKDLVQVTLLVIPSAGFGRRASWQEDSSTTPPPGHKMAFRPAVTSALEHLFTRVLTPEWLYALSEGMYLPFIGPIVKDTKNVYEALKLHMLDLVSLSRAWVVEGKVSNMDAALLRNLVEANMTMQDDEGGPHVHKTLTDDELLSNTWNFLLAGHETSAHSLSFTVGLLALYPDVQDKIYEETIRLWPSGCPTTASNSSYKESMPKLPYTLAVFQETIRLFPSIVRLSKLVQTDTNLQARRFATTSDGDIDDIQEFLVSVPRGSIIMIDILGVHTSPIYWERDAGEFKPERFLDTESYRWPRDAFFAFSTGPRNCIGQRFALTEGVCLLASLVHSYRISVPEHLQGAPFEEQKRLMLKWIPGLTMTPTNCFVRVQRRSSK
ncbi:cytochrome P450 [Mycena vulgaris]|nr:cytochrome P450 [Mycena vulgaris]